MVTQTLSFVLALFVCVMSNTMYCPDCVALRYCAFSARSCRFRFMGAVSRIYPCCTNGRKYLASSLVILSRSCGALYEPLSCLIGMKFDLLIASRHAAAQNCFASPISAKAALVADYILPNIRSTKTIYSELWGLVDVTCVTSDFNSASSLISRCSFAMSEC